MRKQIFMAFVAGIVFGGTLLTIVWSRSYDGEAAIAHLEAAAPVAPSPPGIDSTLADTCTVPNFHRVSDTLYRGGQPSAEGVKQLKAMGFKTIVNLRNYHTNEDLIGETGIGYEHIYFNVFRPDSSEIVRFLQIVTDPDRQPVFVHCLRGSDRTGMMVAAYRVAVQDWSVDDAVAEWTEGPFGFQPPLSYMVRFFRAHDFNNIRQRAGLPTREEPSPTKESPAR